MLSLNSSIGCYHSLGWFWVYLGFALGICRVGLMLFGLMLVQGLFRVGFVGLIYGRFRVYFGLI